MIQGAAVKELSVHVMKQYNHANGNIQIHSHTYKQLTEQQAPLLMNG